MALELRAMEPRDQEALHELYTELADRIPFQWGVGFGQFQDELETTTSREKPGVIEAPIALVTLHAGQVAALATGAVVGPAAQYVSRRTGIVKFVLCRPGAEEACRLAVRGVVEHLDTHAVDEIRALHYWYGPPFYNTGCGRLTGAWPWIGHTLMREGFEAVELPMGRAVVVPVECGAVRIKSNAGASFVRCYAP